MQKWARMIMKTGNAFAMMSQETGLRLLEFATFDDFAFGKHF